VYVVWIDGIFLSEEILFVVSNDNGQTFSTPPDNLSNTAGGSFAPQISSEGNNVYVVWDDDTSGIFTPDIFFARSTDGGLTFSEPPENISNNTGGSEQPQISVEGNNVYVVWSDTTLGDENTFFARSTDGGLTFSEPPENISENTGNSLRPQISSEGNNVYVVWYTVTGNFDIFFSRSTDGGLTFSEPENISENAGLAFDPQISSEGNNVYVVWQDDTPDNDDIFFAVSTDGGLTFSTPENLSENTGGSFDPQISSTISQENPNSEIQMTNPTQQTLSTFQQPGEDSAIISQGTQDSPGLTALEKVEKLKKQWLELLP